MKRFIHRFCLIAASLFLIANTIFSQIFTEQTNMFLPFVRGGNVAWGDYDNDNYLDIILTGYTGSEYITKIYRNNHDNTFYEQGGVTLEAGTNGYGVWGDFNNDSYLDILYSCNTNTIVYYNDGNFHFSDQFIIPAHGKGCPGVDYDNDGNLDIFLMGDYGSYSPLYHNNGDESFTEQVGTPFDGVSPGSSSWGDFDNDGDHDLALLGFGSMDLVYKIFGNNGDKTFSELQSDPYYGLYISSSDWGDFDNDGDLDLIISGADITNNSKSWLKVNGGGYFSSSITSPLGINIKGGTLDWGDYDNDGHLDILITGDTDSESISKIFHNEGDGSFTELTDHELAGVKSSSAAWGDYDNDGDLDIIIAGDSAGYSFTRIYRNEITTPNTVPLAPTGLSSSVNDNSVTLTWDMAQDTETPQDALTYNIRIGTSSLGVDIVSPMASTITGYRRIPARGNAEYNYDGYTIKDLAIGKYYWTIQAIDQAFAGGAWATESSFSIPPDPPVITTAGDITETSFIARWNSSAEATNYYLDVAEGESFTSFLPGYEDYDVGTDTSLLVSGLTSGTQYVYRVRAYCAGASSANSDSMLVKTLRSPDYYVDATDGDNITGEGTAMNPWKTITWTLNHLEGTGRRTIHVAPGTYNTTLGEEFPLMMVDSVSLIGNGAGSSILSADFTNYVITCSGILDPEMTIDGFTIKGGSSVGAAGIYISSGSLLTISNNLITGNTTTGEAYGSAIHIINSSPKVIDNRITDNHGTEIDKGATIYITGTSAPMISGNTFTDNINDVYAGGGTVGAGIVYINGSSDVTVHNNVFLNNSPSVSFNLQYSGDIYIAGCSPRITRNLIARSGGQGIYSLGSASYPSIINNTISDNAYNGILVYGSTPDSIFNNILSYNVHRGITENNTLSDPDKVWYNLFYQNVTGLYYDENTNVYTSVSALNADVPECQYNVTGDPLFVDRTNNNYHLDLSSNAINAGDPNSPTDPDGSRADIGAYYYTPPPDAPVASAATGVTYYSFDATWSIPDGTEGFYLDVSTADDFTSFVEGYNNLDVGYESVYNVSGLAYNTTYFYRVRAYNYNGTSANSNVITVATYIIPPPDDPVALDATDIAMDSFTASWEASDLAEGYHLDVATDETFTIASIVSGYDYVDVSNVTSYSVSSLTPNTTYYYRVRAYNAGGVSTFYSNTISLTTLQEPPPDPPAATAATDITQTTFVANWNASANADGYYLDVSNEGQGTFLTFLDGYNALDVGNVTSYEISGLTHSSQYFYRLRAYNAGGESSNSAVISVITLPDPPPAPVALEATSITHNSFTANWEHAVPNTDGYYIYWTIDNTFANYDSLQLGYITSYNLTGLDPNSTYYYRIRAYNNGGIGENSNVITVTTLEIPPPDAPVAIDAPYVGQTDFKAAWNMSEDATGYYLDVSIDNTFASFVGGYENMDVNNNEDNLYYIVTDLTENTTYYYRVRAYNNSGTSGNSNVITVTTLLNPPDPPPAPTAEPATNVTETGFTANWTSSDNAIGYILDVATDDQFTTYVEGYQDIGIDNSLYCNVTGLTAGTVYYYRVQAYNMGGSSDNSGTITVTTLPGPPPIPLPLSATAITTTGFTANWDDMENTDGYKLSVATDASLTQWVAGYQDLDAGGVTSYNVTGLDPNTTYYYCVSGYNTGGESDNSGGIEVTTLLNMPDLPTAPVADAATDISQTGFSISWTPASSPVEGYYLDIAYDSDFSSYVTGYNSLDVGALTTSTITGLQSDTYYHYRVSAYNVSGTGNYSNVITVRTLPDPPPAPTGLTATSCNDLVFLSWVQSEDDGFDHYTIFVGTSADDTPFWDTVENISDPTYTVSGLTNGETYYFRVKTIITPDVRSDFSSAASVVVKTGVIPQIKAKWNGYVLICYNQNGYLTDFQWYKEGTQTPVGYDQYCVTNGDDGIYYVLTTDQDGCINASNKITVGAAMAAEVYPNPARETFTLSLYSEAFGETVVSLYNSTGTKSMEYRTEKRDTEMTCEIPVGKLHDGVYTVEINVNDEEIFYTRLVIIE